MAIANEQKQEGKKDLADFALSHNSNSLKDLIQQTWKMKEASSALERRKTHRIELIREAASGRCETGCHVEWIDGSPLTNKVKPAVFAAAVRELLLFGRGKYKNIIIVGPTNCAKSFRLKGRLQSLLRMCVRFVMRSLLITCFQSHGVNENTRGPLNRSLLYCKERWHIKSWHKNCHFESFKIKQLILDPGNATNSVA